ncbi:structural maintenance of chromosomes protein 2-like [Ptychodera flava]|uniref:structural maintenance of chromosomes protein 2-like n=1 Tax=Ptychodera flava TaxID=63121 RepID=UPI00396A2B72
MDPKQLVILEKNVSVLSACIQVNKILDFIKRMHPDVFSQEDIRTIYSKYGQSRMECVLEKFKQRHDGYNILFEAMQNTNHNDTVLNALKPGLSIKTVASTGTPRRVKDASQQKRTTRGAVDNRKGKDVRGEKVGENTQNAPSAKADEEKVTQQGDPMTLLLLHMKDLSSKVDTGMKDLSSKVDTNANDLSSKIDNNRDEIMTELDEMNSQFQSFKEDHRKEIEELQKKLQSLEEAILSNTKTQDHLKKDIETMIKDLKKIKTDYESIRETLTQEERERGSREYEIVKKVLEKLTSLDTTDKDKMWQEINKLRQDLDFLKESHETLRSSMRPQRLPDKPVAVATCQAYQSSSSSSDLITAEDVRPLAKKVKVIWSPLSEKMNVDITKTNGRGVMDDEGKAEAVLTKWLAKKNDNHDGGPTWGELHALISQIDLTLADDIVNLRKDID